MSMVWPKVVTLPSLADFVKAMDARLAALEADHAALREELRTRNTGNRLIELEARSERAFAQVAENVVALRAIFTLLHPDENHPPVPAELEWLHDLVMYWLAHYGGRIPEGEIPNERAGEGVR